MFTSLESSWTLGFWNKQNKKTCFLEGLVGQKTRFLWIFIAREHWDFEIQNIKNIKNICFLEGLVTIKTSFLLIFWARPYWDFEKTKNKTKRFYNAHVIHKKTCFLTFFDPTCNGRKWTLIVLPSLTWRKTLIQRFDPTSLASAT